MNQRYIYRGWPFAELVICAVLLLSGCLGSHFRGGWIGNRPAAISFETSEPNQPPISCASLGIEHRASESIAQASARLHVLLFVTATFRMDVLVHGMLHPCGAFLQPGSL